MRSPKVIMAAQLKDKIGWILDNEVAAIDFIRKVPNITECVNTSEGFIAADIVVENWAKSFVYDIEHLKGGFSRIVDNVFYVYKEREWHFNNEDLKSLANGIDAVLKNYRNEVRAEAKKNLIEL